MPEERATYVRVHVLADPDGGRHPGHRQRRRGNQYMANTAAVAFFFNCAALSLPGLLTLSRISVLRLTSNEWKTGLSTPESQKKETVYLYSRGGWPGSCRESKRGRWVNPPATRL